MLKRVRGEAPVFNPRYLDFARHYGFEIVACNVAKGNDQEPKVPQDTGSAGGLA